MNELDIIERYPAVNVRMIVEKALEGYDIEDNLPSWFDDLFILYNGNQDLRNSDEWADTNTFVKVMNADDTDTDSQAGSTGTFSCEVDPVLTFDGAGTYTIPETGTYRFIFYFPTVQINCNATSAGGAVSKDITITSTVVTTIESSTRGTLMTSSQTVNETMGTTSITKTFLVDTRYFELTASEVVSVKVTWAGDYEVVDPPATPGADFSLIIDDENSYAQSRVSRWYGVGSAVKMEDILPDMDILEFFQGLFQYLNISVYYDVFNKKVYLWHYKPDKLIEWTDRVIKGSEDYNYAEAKKYVYRFKEDDYLMMTEDFEFGDGDPKVVELLFSDLSYYYSDVLPALAKEGRTDWQTTGNMRLLRHYGNAAHSYKLHYTNVGGADTTFYTDRTVAPGFILMEMDAFTRPDDSPEQGVFNEYHRNTIESVNEGHVLSCEALLKDTDILDLAYITDDKDWREAFHIHGFNYRLIEAEQLDGNVYRLKLQQIYL